MEKVLGIGGVFFKAKDPVALRKWYEDNLGIANSEWGTVFEPTGITAWSIFPADTEYFLPSEREFMFNYRVANLDAMLDQLRKAGVRVDEKVDESDYGKFGWASDPEGNRFELWQAPESAPEE